MNNPKKFSKSVLYPIFYSYCEKLHEELETLYRIHSDSIVLYEARAGIRLEELYSAYCEKNKLKKIFPEKTLYISRLAAIKGCLYDNLTISAKMLISEFGNQNMGEMLAALDCKFLSYIHRDTVEFPVNYDVFVNLYQSKQRIGDELRDYFKRQSNQFKKYINVTIGASKNVILIDSGWFGSTQRLLMAQFPGIIWKGLYYGKWRYNRPKPIHYDAMKGICIDDSRHHPWNPRRLTLVYYHLIEDFLEPSTPSVIGYSVDNNSNLILDFESNDKKHLEDNTWYSTTLHFIKKHNHKKHNNILFWKYQNDTIAYLVLMYIVLFPTKRSVKSLAVSPRDSNMGKKSSVAVVLCPSDNSSFSRKRRIGKALWKTGQIALEFPPIISFFIQFAFALRLILKNIFKSKRKYG